MGLGALTARLAATAEEPAPLDRALRQAAVALLLREDAGGAGAELLLIRRVERDGDPWSGHLALPGGKVDPQDGSFEEAARRETMEEVAIDLGAEGVRFVGALPATHPRRHGLPISTVQPFAWCVGRDVVAIPSEDEVAAAMWVPLTDLRDEANAVEHVLGARTFAGITVGTDVLWGMTLGILAPLLDRAEPRR
ncbi:MAG: hypothetical protein JWM98_1597 [Thermoleophilia bacterium]|nr:hypothetical protein [Thermoleophilia bacterium]